MKLRKALVAGVAVAAVTVTAGVATAGHSNPLLEGALDGRQEVRDDGDRRIAGDPDGRGEAYVFGIDPDDFGAGPIDNSDTLCYVLVVENIDELHDAPGNGRAAHIHRGAAGENGPVVANLAWPQGGQSADCLTEGELGKGMAPGIVREILADPTAFYVNVHNNEHPSGAVRAQLAEHGQRH